MRHSGSHVSRGVRRCGCALALLLLAGCNPIFDIHEGKPRQLCAEDSLIDDLEDGDESICPTNGRGGDWYVVGDDTAGELNPSSDVFEPSLIEGARGPSRYAARMWGSGFTDWGANLGLALDQGVIGNMIRFWMRSTTPVLVKFPTMQTTPLRAGGECADLADEQNCYNDFYFTITAPSRDWFKYELPFNALRQDAGGSAIWKPRDVTNILFNVRGGAQFDVSIDDPSFDYCPSEECQPTCTDPQFPVPCRQEEGFHSSCQPPGTDCILAGREDVGPIPLDTGGGDPACVGNPPTQPSRCGLFTSAGIPFATEVHPFTDGVSTARLRNPEPGNVCIQGTMVQGGTAAISFVVTKILGDNAPYAIVPFDLQALDITALEFTITNAPSGGVSLELLSVLLPECSAEFDCVGPPLSLGGQNPRVFENGTAHAEMADFELADPGPRLVWTFHVSGHSTSQSDPNYDFCLSDVKFLNSQGEVVTPPPADGG